MDNQKYDGYFSYHTSNKIGLTEIYNEYISPEWDCVIFVHDDVYIDSCNFLKIIYDGFETFDICGVAGGSNLNIKKPLLWHIMTNKESQSGIVNHIHPKRKNYFPTVFGEIGKEVVVIDGLFIAVQPKKLIEKGIKFDCNINGFHHYDIKFSIDCFTSGLKLGTIPINIIHDSIGIEYYDLLNNLDYKNSEEYLYKALSNIYERF